MKYLIVGRTGSGKDYFAEILQKDGLKILKSYTTRPRRNDSDNGHIFIKPEEADVYVDKVATWKLDNGVEYFATRQQVEENDIYIINPDSIVELFENMPELIDKVTVIYIYAESYRKRFKMAMKRTTDKEKEKQIFKERNYAESPEFSRFESCILDRHNPSQMDLRHFYPGVKNVIVVHNNYDLSIVPIAIHLAQPARIMEYSGSLEVKPFEGRIKNMAKAIFKTDNEPLLVTNSFILKLNGCATTNIVDTVIPISYIVHKNK